jgi:hypothetical protein
MPQLRGNEPILGFNITTSPFGNTYEADAVSPKVAIGGCRT